MSIWFNDKEHFDLFWPLYRDPKNRLIITPFEWSVDQFWLGPWRSELELKRTHYPRKQIVNNFNGQICMPQRSRKCKFDVWNEKKNQSKPSNIVFLRVQLLCINKWLCWHTVLMIDSPTSCAYVCQACSQETAWHVTMIDYNDKK